jgi:hypothetical protein
MSYIIPQGDNLVFDYESYTIPQGDSLIFEYDDGLPPEPVPVAINILFNFGGL